MPNNLTSGAIVVIATGAIFIATVAMYTGKKIYKTQFNKDDNIVVNNNNNDLQAEATQSQAELERKKAAQSQAEALEREKAAQSQAELEREKAAEAQRQAAALEREREKAAQRQAAAEEAVTDPINAAVEADTKAREERTIIRLNNVFIQKKERDNPEMIELPFKLLGLTSSATIEDVSKEYRKMALKYHADKSADSGIIFKAIQDALTIINFKRKQKNLVNITLINDTMYHDINSAIQYIELKNEKEDEKPLVEPKDKIKLNISNSSNNLTDIDEGGGKSRKYRQSNQIKRKRKRKTKKYNKINKYNLTK